MRILLPVLLLAALLPAANAANLAPEAAYSVTISGYVYPGQVIPGTNTPATQAGYLPAPPWQGPADALTDGQRTGPAANSWFWSQMDKRISVRFDLRRNAAVTALRLWPAADGSGFSSASWRLAASAADLAQAPELPLQPAAEGMAWQGAAQTGRFVEVVCASAAPAMDLAEVEIEGDAVSEVAADAPPPGLHAIPPRDLAPLTKLPERPVGVTNLLSSAAAKVTVSSRHYDDKIGSWSDDRCAADSDPDGRALQDGNRGSAVRSWSGWYGAKRLRIEGNLGQAARLRQVIVWSAGHDQARTFINCVKLWLQAGEGAAWSPAGEVWNPLLPGEVPGPEYPIVSPVIDRIATGLRLELEGVAQSADLMQVGEVEVWGQAADQPLIASPWRLRQPVPAIPPVAMGTLDPAYDWLRQERLRGLYTYIDMWRNADLLDHAAAAGFNCLLVHTMGKTHSEAGWPAEVAAWAKVQQERSLRVIVSWPFGSDERYGNTQFGAYQPGGAVTWQRGPCPLAREYWDRVVADRALIAAQAGLTGLVVDMEMYGADATRYPGSCCCDRCWGRFVGAHLEGIAAAAVALSDRPAWISANGLVADYARWQELQLMAILQAIRERVRAVNPRFLLGNLLDPESLPGLARGFGTATMPALVFSELEYHGGIAGVPDRLEQLQRQGYPLWYVPGLWIKPVNPPQLPELVRTLGPATGGYWIWSSAALMPGASGEYAPAPGYGAADFWPAFRLANTALSSALQAGAAAAAPAPGGPRATVPRLVGREATAADWARAAVLGPFVGHRAGEPAQAATTARALWDGRRLLLWVQCAEPNAAALSALHGERDDPTLWQQDSLEIFWRRPTSGAYAHVIVNAAGTVADAFSDGIRPEDPGWNAAISATAQRPEPQWELHLELPLAADGADDLPAGATIRFELARNRPAAGETTCWAPTGGMFRGAPNLWGTLLLE